ncbi:hypothetical protein BJY01DRAFT_243558 [Aspergillus pseudoustus]|uniref:Mid2 domain-containing protein n=1 Tax=Aspergillus pseudoustus TaxID=1810923 RepID=A0ABR4KRM7_9EURO
MTSTLARTTRSTIDQEELTSPSNVPASISTSATSSVTTSPRSTSTAVSVPPPSSQANTAMIRGIVGGVAALLIMIVAIAYLVYRAKKQKRFTLLNWRSDPRTKDPIRAIEAGEVAYKGQTRSQPSGTAVETITLNPQNAQSTDMPPDPSPTRSLELSARITHPEALHPPPFQ